MRTALESSSDMHTFSPDVRTALESCFYIIEHIEVADEFITWKKNSFNAIFRNET